MKQIQIIGHLGKDYEDEKNYLREIQLNEYFRFRIKKDDACVKEIISRGVFFQNIKNHFKT